MRIFAIILAVLLAGPIHAQDDPRQAAAERFVESRGQQAMMDAMLSTEAVMTQMGAYSGQVSEEKVPALAAIVAEELAAIRSTMEDAIAAGMADSFTLEEIEALADFYDSGPGASAMEKMNPYMGRVMQRIGPELQAMQARLSQRVQTEMAR